MWRWVSLRSADPTILTSPAQSVLRPPARLVLAADPAGVAEPVERVEHGRVVDLSFVRLGARRHRRDLHVADDREKPFEAGEQIAADNLHVIEVELDLDVRPPDLCDQIR